VARPTVAPTGMLSVISYPFYEVNLFYDFYDFYDFYEIPMSGELTSCNGQRTTAN
jgi:hypothetical protein